MSEATDPWYAPTGCASMVLCLAGGYVGYEAADACVVAWWQHWGEGWMAKFGVVAGGALGLALGFALMRSLRDAFALVRAAPPPDAFEGRSSSAKALSRGFVALSLLATFVALAVVGFGGLGRREVSPPGCFRVVMPGQPIEQDEGERAPGARDGQAVRVCRGSEQGYMLTRLHVYGVAFLDYPPSYIARNALEVIFKEQRDTLVTAGCELVSEKTSHWADSPAPNCGSRRETGK